MSTEKTTEELINDYREEMKLGPEVPDFIVPLRKGLYQVLLEMVPPEADTDKEREGVNSLLDGMEYRAIFQFHRVCTFIANNPSLWKGQAG